MTAMSLTTRLLAFFLQAQAAVLAGAGVGLWWAARTHLLGEADRRLESALSALSAAAEARGRAGLVWPRGAGRVALGRDDGPEAVRWVVRDGDGRLVDRSANLADGGELPVPGDPGWRTAERRLTAPAKPDDDEKEEDLAPDALPPAVRAAAEAAMPGVAPVSAERETDDGRVRYRVRFERDGRRTDLDFAENGTPLGRRDRTAPPRGDGEPLGNTPKHRGLRITAALPAGPADEALRLLAAVLAGGSAGLMLVSAAIGRRLCRRALAPLSAMAAEAEGLSPAGLSPDGPLLRLTELATGDETAALARSFNRLLARLEAAFDRERRFSADAAHQLRTPLTAVIGQAEVALRRNRPAEEYRRVLELSLRRLGGLRDAAESLLMLARHEPGAGPPTGDAVSVPDLVLGAADRWAAHARAGDLSVRTAGADGCAVTGDARLLAQALDNLIDNSLRHTAPGTPVRLIAERQGPEVVLAVEDDGPGIAPEDRMQLFRPFHRGRSAGGVPGAGLGLSVARRLIEAHGGRIDLADGSGCRFEIRLPLRR